MIRHMVPRSAPKPIFDVRRIDDPAAQGGYREVCNDKTLGGKLEYRRRRDAMWDRQKGLCAICGRFMHGRDGDVVEYAFDHEAGRGNGASRRCDKILVYDENGNEIWQNAALCHPCNTAKASKRYMWMGGKYVRC